MKKSTRSRRWAQAATGTWHLAYDMSATFWTAECRAFTTLQGDPIELKRSTLRVHPKDPVCKRCEKIAASYAKGTKA
ncbi:MAG: hypothetical protein M1272_07390 [Firmicutes bacterium]|nr:hypothetical protein [Bacillota bacterium]